MFSGSGEEDDGPVVQSCEAETEPDSYWKKKEAFLRGSTLSLGEKFSTGTCNPASPQSISWLVAFFFHSFFLFLLLRRPEFTWTRLIALSSVCRGIFPHLIFMHTDEAHFPPRLLMFYSISNSAPSTPPPTEFRHSNGFKWTHCKSNKGALMALLFLRDAGCAHKAPCSNVDWLKIVVLYPYNFWTLSNETSLMSVPAPSLVG